jgi:hypothetical protein
MPCVYIDGFKMHYDVAGEGPPLLLLHGLGSSCADWLLQVPVFSETHHVIAPDCRGHGDSDKPPGPYAIELFASDVLALLNRLDVAQAHVLGVSISTTIWRKDNTGDKMTDKPGSQWYNEHQSSHARLCRTLLASGPTPRPGC